MITRLLAAIAFLCLATAAQAQNNWSAPATACIPSHDTIGRYESDTAWVRFLGVETGVLTFTCQMDRFNSGTSTYNLKITYRDSTGMGTSASVRAQLYRMAHGTTSPVLLGEATSNSSAAGNINTVGSSDINHMFDFEANAYWVHVLLKRSNTSQIITLYSLVLDGAAF
jgi:hypothetical protein